jgi:hypothetical protein
MSLGSWLLSSLSWMFRKSKIPWDKLLVVSVKVILSKYGVSTLLVLKHPYIPLHNNEAELAARKEVRYRDISFQTRSKKGTQAKDTFFTIIQTCYKLGVNAYEYILDRMKRKPTMISLDQLVLSKTKLTF